MLVAMGRRRALALAGVTALVVGLMVSSAARAEANDDHNARVLKPKVWTVGVWHGKVGQFHTIQAAVDAASPGDSIVIAPGDYKERGDYTTHRPTSMTGAGVWVDKSNLHLVGLSRDGVVVDGTKSGRVCSSSAADQDRGPANGAGSWGRNGIEVYQASGVTIQNLTVCNFLSGSDGSGNQIWWNGGYDTKQIGMHSYLGSYLTTTTTYYDTADPAQATYGIFVSNADGPGLIDHAYASNMNDSGYYIGACGDCNAVLTRSHAENNVLGYSGTNSGGHLVISDSEWNDNGEGLDTNSQSSGDLPAPQDGACPSGNGSCMIITGNWIHDNNNRDVPGNGLGLVGAGVVVAGGRNDTIAHNRFSNNGAWAVALVPYITGAADATDCTGAGGTWDNAWVDSLAGGSACFFNDYGTTVHDNQFTGNGSFGNPTNGDLADLSDFSAIGIPGAAPGQGNCWYDNHDPAGITSAPASLQTTNGQCATAGPGAGVSDALFAQVLCNLHQLQPSDQLCGGAVYPQQSASFSLMPLPKQPTMPEPCELLPRKLSSWSCHQGSH